MVTIEEGEGFSEGDWGGGEGEGDHGVLGMRACVHLDLCDVNCEQLRDLQMMEECDDPTKRPRIGGQQDRCDNIKCATTAEGTFFFRYSSREDLMYHCLTTSNSIFYYIFFNIK